MNDRSLEVFRMFLTVVGIALLFIFGVQAAGQARDMKLAGAVHPNVFLEGIDQDAARVLGIVSEPIDLPDIKTTTQSKNVAVQPAASPPTAQSTPANQASPSPSQVAPALPQNSPSLVPGTVSSKPTKGVTVKKIDKTLNKTQKIIQKVTDKAGKNDFTKLLP